MTRKRLTKLCRYNLGLLLVATAFVAPANAQDIAADYDSGIKLYQQGRYEEALAEFTKVLAANPTNQQAYELFKSTEYHLLLDMMVRGGEYDRVARRLQELSKLARTERKNDGDAIKAILRDLRTNTDAVARRQQILKMAAEHGEFAVQYMVRDLVDGSEDNTRVIMMHAMTTMGTDVVLPLIEALATEDAYQRRNVAIVLGLIGDPRAASVLSALSQSDTDGGVVKASAEAAVRCGAAGRSLAQLLSSGDSYHHRSPNVLRAIDYSTVVWGWTGGALVARPVPRAIYNNEMSKKLYYRALAVDVSSLEARAGIARAGVDIEAKLSSLAAAGSDVADLQTMAAEGRLAVLSSGVDALDLALQWSVATGDANSGIRLCQTLGNMSSTPTAGLLAALQSNDGGMRGEAAVALGQIAWTSSTVAAADVIGMLAASTGRSIARLVAVIATDDARTQGVIAGLNSTEVIVNPRSTGAAGLAMLHSVPGVDVVLVGDALSDLTLDAVIQGIKENTATAETPIYLITEDSDLADLYSDRIAGSFSGADNLSALDDVFSASLEGDRAQADDLARRSAGVLARLAQAGRTDIGAALGSLASTLGPRGDHVTLPAMSALAASGNADQVAALVAVVADGGRSDEARIAAADALSGIFGRTAVDASQCAALVATVTGDAAIAVRHAAARAVGRMQLDDAGRAELLRNSRVDVAGE